MLYIPGAQYMAEGYSVVCIVYNNRKVVGGDLKLDVKYQLCEDFQSVSSKYTAGDRCNTGHRILCYNWFD